MNKNLIVANSIEIAADKNHVWDLLINPEKIKIYFFGTETICDWKPGASLVFQGEYQGTIYKDKGVIIQFVPGEILQFSYLSSFTGLNDEPDNYSLVTYNLSETGTATRLKVTQVGFVSEQARDHSNTAWGNVLKKMKELAEV